MLEQISKQPGVGKIIWISSISSDVNKFDPKHSLLGKSAFPEGPARIEIDHFK